ncbi:lysoplasmalogenase [Inhella gelatinilytica]|uniref:Lysoplasmalogenase n=1 Tax=Inhella gelatinilytica TaxID=2795030 RepID=A0A931IXA4_9BURK|nr:lysoplasmalogenase [Inhella gelatinilytica]MBH9553602.1 lysoplasmalogenase [Inhella gelatinilytica]
MLLLLAAVLGLVFVAADLAWLPDVLRFAAKPAATLALIAWAWPRGAFQPLQRRWLRVGLLFSLGGDVALLWPQQGFLPGLVSFLLAHLAFIRSLSIQVRFGARLEPLLGYAALAGVLLGGILWPGLPADLRVPVLVYVAVLVAMAGQGAAWWLQARSRAAAYAALGGAAFLVSDSLIALDRFAGGVPLATVWIHSLYWLSLALMISALPRTAPR